MSKNILLSLVFFISFGAVSEEQLNNATKLTVEKTATSVDEEPTEQLVINEEIDAAALLAEQQALKVKQQRLQVQVNFCAPCHGKTGVSAIDIYPNLAGQQSDYLLKQLRDFKSKARKDNVMNGMVSRLTDEDMQELAQFYAGIEIEIQQPSVEAKDEKVISTDL
ncbi:MAG: cytochrome c [Thalassotalea sp.]|nr:cytochrome c [Thalassotalea sp.]MDG2394172.1 cytochrome c [Thalassotalea sp.]